MGIAENLAAIREAVNRAALDCGRDPASVTLVAATKTRSGEDIRRAIAAGITVCGENRAQELTAHLVERTYEGAEVHFIGQLQTNKVKYVVGKVSLIHSASSEKLLLAINRQGEKLGIVQDILLEADLAGEEGKAGFPPARLLEAATLTQALPHVRLRGLMCIPPPARFPGQNTPYFSKLRQMAVDIREKIGDNDIACLSMGMSGDFADAVREGATHIRLGTALFGPRVYPPKG